MAVPKTPDNRSRVLARYPVRPPASRTWRHSAGRDWDCDYGALQNCRRAVQRLSQLMVLAALDHRGRWQLRLVAQGV